MQPVKCDVSWNNETSPHIRLNAKQLYPQLINPVFHSDSSKFLRLTDRLNPQPQILTLINYITYIELARLPCVEGVTGPFLSKWRPQPFTDSNQLVTSTDQERRKETGKVSHLAFCGITAFLNLPGLTWYVGNESVENYIHRFIEIPFNAWTEEWININSEIRVVSFAV